MRKFEVVLQNEKRKLQHMCYMDRLTFAETVVQANLHQRILGPGWRITSIAETNNSIEDLMDLPNSRW